MWARPVRRGRGSGGNRGWKFDERVEELGWDDTVEGTLGKEAHDGGGTHPEFVGGGESCIPGVTGNDHANSNALGYSLDECLIVSVGKQRKEVLGFILSKLGERFLELMHFLDVRSPDLGIKGGQNN